MADEDLFIKGRNEVFQKAIEMVEEMRKSETPEDSVLLKPPGKHSYSLWDKNIARQFTPRLADVAGYFLRALRDDHADIVQQEIPEHKLDDLQGGRDYALDLVPDLMNFMAYGVEYRFEPDVGKVQPFITAEIPMPDQSLERIKDAFKQNMTREMTNFVGSFSSAPKGRQPGKPSPAR